MTGSQFLAIAYYIGAPATSAIIAVVVTLYVVQKYPRTQKTAEMRVNGSAGERSVDFWRSELRVAAQESVKILDRQADILDEMRVAISALGNSIAVLVALETRRQQKE